MATKKDMLEAIRNIDAIEQQTQAVKQNADNKSHDPEFSAFSEGTGGETMQIIGEAEVKEAYKIFQDYREKKSPLEKKIVENEEFWKLNHWETVKADDKRIKPKSSWLFNTIINKHADAMDNYPEPNILPRSMDDEETAKVLSSVVPVILEQNDYESTYSAAQWYKQKQGTSVQGVFWDNDKENGLGQAVVEKIDLLDIYWKPGISDIQESPNVFVVSMVESEELKTRYPQIKVGNQPSTYPESYVGQEDTSHEGETAVIDWYYKRRQEGTDENGIPYRKVTLHYCKFANEQVIYASENDPKYSERGYYDHGLYPFVFDTLFPVERSICGMGYIDVTKDDQLYIDKLQQAILENAVSNARPRWAVRIGAGINKEQFLDTSEPIVDCEGGLGQDDFRQIVAQPLSGIYENVYQLKIEEMKQTSGNTASSQGQVSSVTAASGIASLQEAAGKLSRDANSGSYRAFKQVVYLIIELIRQFYDMPRCFRIAGEQGNEYITFDNRGLTPQPLGTDPAGFDLGSRLPIMDIKVRPQKRSAYAKETQNQTAMNLYSAGFFTPGNADAALACLEMMDFEGIEKVKQSVQRMGGMYEQMMTMQMMMQQLTGIQAPQEQENKKGGEIKERKGSLATQASQATRESTAPR